MLNATITPTPAPTPSPPSQFQAVLSSYLDGAYLETNSLLHEFMSSPADFDSPSATTNDSAAAAAAGINLNAVQSLYALLGNTQTALDLDNGANFRSLGVMSDIRFSSQYAGVFASYALMAGAQTALQAVKQ